MADSSTIVLTGDNSQNQIKIDLNVLEVILGIAAVKVDGVYEMRGTLSSTVNQLFGRNNKGKGVDLKVVDDKLVANVYAYFNQDVSVPKVALALQQKLRDQLVQMTDLKLDEINVHVVGLYAPKVAKQTASGSIFSEDAEKKEGN